LLRRQQIWPILLSKKQVAAGAANVLLFDDTHLRRCGCLEFQKTANQAFISPRNAFLMFAVVPLGTLLTQQRFACIARNIIILDT
jgi:hypothetical protein